MMSRAGDAKSFLTWSLVSLLTLHMDSDCLGQNFILLHSDSLLYYCWD